MGFLEIQKMQMPTKVQISNANPLHQNLIQNLQNLNV